MHKADDRSVTGRCLVPSPGSSLTIWASHLFLSCTTGTVDREKIQIRTLSRLCTLHLVGLSHLASSLLLLPTSGTLRHRRAIGATAPAMVLVSVGDALYIHRDV